MEAAAIDKIGAINQAIAERLADQTADEALYLPAGVTLARAEQFAAQPRFMRHQYATERLIDFIAYTTKAAADAGEDYSPTAYVLPDGSGAVAVFDHGHLGEPQWGHHKAELKLRTAPAWSAALCMAGPGGPLSQTQVIDWIEDWSDALTAHSQDGSEIETRRAITALRRIKIEAKASTVNEEGDFAINRTALESIEARGETETLPAYFVLHSPLYVGTNLIEIVIRIGVRDREGKPGIVLRIVGRELLQEATSAWVETKLRTELGDKLAGVYVGSLAIGKP